MKYTVWEVQVCIFMKEKQKQDSDHLDPVLSATVRILKTEIYNI